MQHFTARIFLVNKSFGQFGLFRDILTFCGFMDFQLFGLFDELNAQAGLPNEPRNILCAAGHLPGPMEPSTAQRRPTFLHGRIFGLSELRGYFEITLKSESPMQIDKIGQPHAPSTGESGGTSGTY